MEVRMGDVNGEIVFEFRSDERSNESKVKVYKVRRGKLELITTVTVADIWSLARIFDWCPHHQDFQKRIVPEQKLPYRKGSQISGLKST